MFAAAVRLAMGSMSRTLGVATHRLWLFYLGYGVIGGMGLGVGYISPVSTLIKWFPDRPGLVALGDPIDGFPTPVSFSSVKPQALITTHNVDVDTAFGTKQFGLLWIVLCTNVTAGIGIL
jgi:hypothetical protein